MVDIGQPAGDVRRAARVSSCMTLAKWGLLLGLIAGSRARAQDVSVTWMAQGTNDPMWRNPSAVSARGAVPLGRYVDLMVGYWGARSRGVHVGSPCTGFVYPGTDCTPEPQVDVGTFRTQGIGVGTRVVDRPSFGVRAVALAQWVRGRSATTRWTGGPVRGATQQYKGGSGGVELRWTPRRLSGVGVIGIADAALWLPRRPEPCADCYRPFDKRVVVGQLGVGLQWDRRK